MPATDNFQSETRYMGGSARSAFSITPSTNELSVTTRGIYVGGTGDVVCTLQDDSSAVTFTSVPTGTILPVCAKVVSTSSTATFMLGLV